MEQNLVHLMIKYADQQREEMDAFWHNLERDEERLVGKYEVLFRWIDSGRADYYLRLYISTIQRMSRAEKALYYTVVHGSYYPVDDDDDEDDEPFDDKPKPDQLERILKNYELDHQ